MNIIESKIRPRIVKTILAGIGAYQHQRLVEFRDEGSYSTRLGNTAVEEGLTAFWRAALDMTRERKGNRDPLTLEVMTAATLLGSTLLSLKNAAMVARKPLVCLGLTWTAQKLLRYGYLFGENPKNQTQQTQQPETQKPIHQSRFGTYKSIGIIGDPDKPSGFYSQRGIGTDDSRAHFDPTKDRCPADTRAREANEAANNKFNRQSKGIRGR